MKEMNKAKIIDKKSEKSVKSERDLLSKLNHPFIINMHYSFQDSDNLYLIMDLLTGGDLRYHICKKRYFTEDQTKFFISCILLGLEYCHYYSIIHRDIKPENLVLDSKGYVHITDFGIAKIQVADNHRETSGTPGYMSPEVLCGQNHTIAVDYFALGVMGYEFMLGMRPYLGKNRKEIKEKVMAKQAIIHKRDIMEGWSLEAADCINRLLQRKPRKRLGVNGAKDVKKHIWFKNYPWNDLYNNKLISPFIPPGEDNFDYKYCNNVEKQGLQTKERYAEIIISDNYKICFKTYLYFNRYDNRYNDNGKIYPNIHDKIYKRINPHNRNRSVVTDFSNYRRYSSNKKFNIIENNNKVLINHGRAFSAMGVFQNKAFLEANNYIKKKRSSKNENEICNNINNTNHTNKLETNKSKKNIFINNSNNDSHKCKINKIKIFTVNNNKGNLNSTNGNVDIISKDKENHNTYNTNVNKSKNISSKLEK